MSETVAQILEFETFDDLKDFKTGLYIFRGNYIAPRLEGHWEFVSVKEILDYQLRRTNV